jgi:hypothetical protein
MPHKPSSPELSPSRGVLSRLEFPFLLTFLIFLIFIFTARID